jgi:predicted dehydrogenase
MGNSQAPIPVLVVGCGAAFENLYVRPLDRLVRDGAIRVAGLVEASPKRRDWAVGRYHGAAVFEDVGAALTTVRPALTLIISPPRFHAAQACAAMAAGSHVLCEKPLADTPAAGAEIVRAARANGRLVGVEMARRFHPNSAVVRDWIQSGKLGQVLGYEYREGSIYSWPVVSEAAFQRNVAGGGVLQDKGVHVLDLLGWIFGPAELVGYEDDAWSGGVEANSCLRLRHGEVAGFLQLSWDQELNNGFWVRGRAGELFMPVGPVDFFLIRQPGEPWQRREAVVSWPTGACLKEPPQINPKTAYAGIEMQIIHMVRAVLHGEAVPVPPEDGLRTLELIDAAYRMARPLAQAWLAAQEQAEQAKRHWNCQADA